MDNRNLSEKEKSELEETRRATLAKRRSSNKATNIVKDQNADDLDEQGLSQSEIKIVRQERKKRIINHMLCQTFHMADERKLNNITQKSCWESLVDSHPAAF